MGIISYLISMGKTGFSGKETYLDYLEARAKIFGATSITGSVFIQIIQPSLRSVTSLSKTLRTNRRHIRFDGFVVVSDQSQISSYPFLTRGIQHVLRFRFYSMPKMRSSWNVQDHYAKWWSGHQLQLMPQKLHCRS